MKGKLYKSVKSREEIESSQLFSTMLQKVGSTGAVVIDGKNLMADSIYARHIQSKQITTDHLVVGVATADLINTGGLEITDELKVVHGGKDVLFINSDGALEMNISALKIGLVDFEKDINTEIKAIAGSWSQLNLNKAGDIISGINANDKGTNIHGKNISLTGDTDVQGDFRVSGNQVILNADTDIRGDFKVSGGSVVLDANTDIRGDFTVSGNKVVLDAETTVLDTFTVKGDMLASNLDVEQLTIRAKNGLQNVLHIDSTGRVELNVDRFHIKAIDVESELANRATKEEVEGIGLADKTGILSGTEIYTDKADDSVVHVEIDGKSVGGGAGKNLLGSTWYAYTPYNTTPEIIDIYSNTIRFTTNNVDGGMIAIGSGSEHKQGVMHTLSGYMTKNGLPVKRSEWASSRFDTHADYGTISVDDTTGYFAISQVTNSLWNIHTDISSNIGDVFEIKNFQFEEGSTATQYEPAAPTPDQPIEIHSLNDFDVVSGVGRENIVQESNIFKQGISANGVSGTIAKEGYLKVITTAGNDNWHTDWFSSSSSIESSFKEGDIFTVSFTIRRIAGTGSPTIYIKRGMGYYYMGDIENDNFQTISYTGKWKKEHGLRPHLGWGGTVGTFEIKNWKIEKGNKATDWTPAPEDITENDNHTLIDKINILLNEPLRSVGDVKDRLFRDNDGLWKVERNVGESVIDGTETGNWHIGTSSLDSAYVWFHKRQSSYGMDRPYVYNSPVAMSSFKDLVGGNYRMLNQEGFSKWVDTTPFIFSMKLSRLNSFNDAGIDAWFRSNPTTVLYELANPVIETLDQELQGKLNNLRSFQESNYVYTVINDKTDILPENLKPQIHTTFKGGGWYSRWKTEDELANRATKKELENIELTPGPPGPKGDKGDKGVDGRSISNVVIEYAASLSRTQVPPQSEFSPNTPIWSSGKYIWSQTRTTYEDNKPDSVSKPAVITGDEGQSVLDITQEYAVTTSKTIVPSSYQFSTTRAAWEIGRYVWTRSKITYENPTKVDYTTPVVSTEWEAVNDIDAKINNAVTTIDGTGVTVKDGNFFLEDDSSSEKYSLKIKTNLITDHGIEFVSPTTAATNISGGATFNMAKEVYSGSHNNVYSHMPTGNIDIWSIGSPYLYISYLPNDFVNADYTPIFGATSGVVNNQNYFEAKVDSRISKNTTYTFSAHFKKHPNMTGSYPKIEVFQRKKQSTLEYRLASETFSYTSSNEDVIRYSVTFTTNNEFSTGMYFLRLRVTSSNSNYVMVDGLQLVEGNHPVQYHSEDTASFYQRDNRTQISGLQFDVRQLQSNKPIHSQGTAGQGKWIRFEDGMAIVEYYIRTIPGSSWTQWGSMWYLYLEYHWDFPIYFQNPPAVTGSLSTGAAFLMPTRVSNQRASSIAVYRPVSTEVWSTGQWVYLSAIGRWKN